MRQHQLQIGSIKLTILHDGTKPSSADTYIGMLDETPADDVRKASQELYPDPAKFMGYSFNCLLIETDNTRTLVDTGNGPNFLPDQGHVQRDSPDPTNIDRVIITHCHGDHYRGLVNADGTPLYPNAELLISDVEWNHWMGQDGVITRDADSAKALNHAFAPYEGKVTFIDFNKEVELIPGVTSLPIPGHTPGHIGLMIESQGQRLLDAVDLIHTGVQMQNPDWSILYDNDKPLAVQNRKKMLNRAIDEQLLTLLYHFQFPGLGHVRRQGDAFRWEPVK